MEFFPEKWAPISGYPRSALNAAQVGYADLDGFPGNASKTRTPTCGDDSALTSIN
jgi:hypothetical protein